MILSKTKDPQKTFSASATKEQLWQMEKLTEELRWNRSIIIRMAINLMFDLHKSDPKKFGV